jgi:hypothetical protein
MLFSYCTRTEKALRTSGEVLFRHLGNAFGKHNSETPEIVATVSQHGKKVDMKTKTRLTHSSASRCGSGGTTGRGYR